MDIDEINVNLSKKSDLTTNLTDDSLVQISEEQPSPPKISTPFDYLKVSPQTGENSNTRVSIQPDFPKKRRS